MFVNFFQPSFKLAEKHRDGAKVCKRYHAPATPFQRLMDDPGASERTRKQLRDTAAGLDPVRLLRDIRSAQQKLVVLADAVVSAAPAETTPPPLDAFLRSLKTLWQDGEARPTATGKPPQKRARRRPDPLVEVADQLKTWFEDEPWRTGRELLERLQAEQRGVYPDALLRTVQRRLKGWRTDQARTLVFSHSSASGNEATAKTGEITVAAQRVAAPPCLRLSSTATRHAQWL